MVCSHSFIYTYTYPQPSLVPILIFPHSSSHVHPRLTTELTLPPHACLCCEQLDILHLLRGCRGFILEWIPRWTKVIMAEWMAKCGWWWWNEGGNDKIRFMLDNVRLVWSSRDVASSILLHTHLAFIILVGPSPVTGTQTGVQMCAQSVHKRSSGQLFRAVLVARLFDSMENFLWICLMFFTSCLFPTASATRGTWQHITCVRHSKSRGILVAHQCLRLSFEFKSCLYIMTLGWGCWRYENVYSTYNGVVTHGFFCLPVLSISCWRVSSSISLNSFKAASYACKLSINKNQQTDTRTDNCHRRQSHCTRILQFKNHSHLRICPYESFLFLGLVSLCLFFGLTRRWMDKFLKDELQMDDLGKSEVRVFSIYLSIICDGTTKMHTHTHKEAHATLTPLSIQHTNTLAAVRRDASRTAFFFAWISLNICSYSSCVREQRLVGLDSALVQPIKVTTLHPGRDLLFSLGFLSLSLYLWCEDKFKLFCILISAHPVRDGLCRNTNITVPQHNQTPSP